MRQVLRAREDQLRTEEMTMVLCAAEKDRQGSYHLAVVAWGSGQVDGRG